MNKVLIIFFANVFLLTPTSVFSQKMNEVIATGKVYISESISNGAIGYPSTSQGPYLFKNQNIYFIKDSIKVITKTNSMGVFSISLKEGQYRIYQEEGLNNNHRGLQQFGTYSIEVKKGSGPFMVEFQNSSNRRSTISGGKNGKGLPGSNTPKNIQTTSEK